MKTHHLFKSATLFIALLAVAGQSTAADGLVGRYNSGYSVVSNRIVFDGLTLVGAQTNTVFDFWNGSQYYDWNPFGGGFYSVQWTGFLHITNAGLYGFGTISDDGSEIYLNDQRVVDNHEEQWFDWQEGWCYLGAGYHAIEIKFFERHSFSGIEVWWLKPEDGPSVLPYSGETFHTIPPTFNPGTKWQILSAPAVQTEAPYVNPRLHVRRLTSPNEVELSWPGFPNVSYTLQSSTNLINWQNKTGGLPGISGVMTQTVSLTTPHEFFRVRLSP